MDWSPAELSANFARGVIGFDFRAAPPQIPARSDVQYLGTWYDERTLRLTVDQFVWPRFWEERDARWFNRWGLADEEEDLNVGAKFPNPTARIQSILVAFDMPASWIEWRGQQFSSQYNGLAAQRFKFNGFDIVDPWFVDGSALYSFNWDAEEMNKILKEIGVSINNVGLISADVEALHAAVYFTRRLTSPNHRVFAPCGVWTVT